MKCCGFLADLTQNPLYMYICVCVPAAGAHFPFSQPFSYIAATR